MTRFPGGPAAPAATKPHTSTLEPATVRVALSTVVIFAIIFSPLLLWGASLLLNTPKTAEGALVMAAYAFAVYWACSPRIELRPGRIIYRALFIKREIDLAKVVRVSAYAAPAPSLAFRTEKRERHLARFIIKPFSRNGIVVLLRHVREAYPSIHFDAVTEDMISADLHSITQEAMATGNLLRIGFIVGATALGAAIIKALLHA